MTIPENERDLELAAKLKSEGSGILRWALEGLAEWKRLGGLHHPRFVISATERYRDNEDVIGAFLSDRCVRSPQCTARAAQLYQTYSTWCEESGERPLTLRNFKQTMIDRGFQQRHRHEGFVWLDIGVLEA